MAKSYPMDIALIRHYGRGSDAVLVEIMVQFTPNMDAANNLIRRMAAKGAFLKISDGKTSWGKVNAIQEYRVEKFKEYCAKNGVIVKYLGET